MRGKRFAALKLLLLPACLLGAGLAAAEDTPPVPAPSQGLPAAIVVFDASHSMGDKLGDKVKLDTARTELGKAVTQYSDQVSLGLIAFGHRQKSNCADAEVLAKPGALNAGNYENLLGGIKAKGQAPIVAAISDAVSLVASDEPLDVVLIADGGDTCDADICVTADALKQTSKGLRIHVVALGDKAEDLKPLNCAATATGGKFVSATNAGEFEKGLAAVLDTIANPPIANEAMAAANAMTTQGAPMGAPAETSVQRALPPPKPEPIVPVTVSFKARITEIGPQLQKGITWRVYDSKAGTDGQYRLISTHRESAPSASLLPGEYLVNVAYGLSNLTKKIKVEKEEIDETFVLNTGGLALRAVQPDGQPCTEGSVRFDILSDEEDQFGKRETILADAKPRTAIRLNAGAYHIVSLYGNANANVGVDVTVEPGRITEATIKHSGAKITFRLVQTAGGEALANTKWKILTSAGDTVKSNAGALPTHILAAGSYAVVAEYGGLSYTRKFSIDPGDDQQIEVVVANGPTSPEALSALLDPPEAPPPGASTLAGDGPPKFNGFKPADPNAPLINPGTLFRPSSRR
jgi:hypothetical protein